MLFILTVAVGGLYSGQFVTVEVSRYFYNEAQAATSDSAKEKQDRYRNLELFQKVVHFVETNYVDEVGNQKLIYGAIKGMLQTLDPHSNFLPPEIYKDMKIDTDGKFGGLGIEIGMRDNILTIIAPIEDTPAWKAGLKPGDRIVKINGVSTKGLSLAEAVSKMRGKPGSKVTISIFRSGFSGIKEVSIKRAIVKVQAVRSESLELGYPYIKLRTFNKDAAKQMEAAVKKYEKIGRIRGVVLDLRNNPGGLLDKAVEITSLFVEKGVVVSTIGRNPNEKKLMHVIQGKARTSFPIAVLVNSATASAAEIVAGALQDHRRAVIMGQPTFGKGSVQTVISLSDNMGLKLTTQRYYTPNGTSIQGKGLIPDIILDQYDPKLLAKARIKRTASRERDLPGALKGNEEPVPFSVEELQSLGPKKNQRDKVPDMTPLRLDPKDDFQVSEALNYLKSFEIFKKLNIQDKPKPAATEDDTAGT